MLASSKILTSTATVVALLCLALPAAAATWTTEPVPAGPGHSAGSPVVRRPGARAVPLGRGADGVAVALYRHGHAWPIGGWTRLANLRGVGWGNAQALQYATTRVLFVSGQVASVGASNRAKLRLVAAYGRSDGSALGSWQTLAPSETGFVAAANHSGHSIVLFDAGGNGVRRSSGPRAGSSARRRRSRRPAPSRLRSQSTRMATASSPGSAPGASRRASATRATAGARCSTSRRPPACQTRRCRPR